MKKVAVLSRVGLTQGFETDPAVARGEGSTAT